MNLDDRAIQAGRLDLDANQLLALQLREQPIQHAGLGPAVHASVNGMPIAKALRQCTPFAAILCYIENRVDHCEILMRNVATLCGKMSFDPSKLSGCDFHALSISDSVNRP